MTVTAEAATFASRTRAADIPSDVAAAAKRSVVDGFGLAVAGLRSAPGSLATRYAAEFAPAVGGGTARQPRTRTRLPARFAAFAAGVCIHADDFDDTQLAVSADRVYGLLTHPTAPVLAAAAAVADARDLSGADLLTGYTVGVEVATKVAEAINPRHYQDGFHSTGTAGTIGAAAAAANLLGLDPAATARVLGLAASQAAGLRENFGTMTKPFHAGRAAESAVVSADLVGRGWTAAPDILEADRGFFRAAGGGFDPSLISGQLGAPWTFSEPGVSIKPYPSGSLTHPAMCALADIVTSQDIKPADIAQIYVGTNRHMPTALIHHRPANALQAKFSMEYCLAVTAIERTPGLADFTDERVDRPDVQDLLRRVEFAVAPEADAAGYNTMYSIVRVTLASGAAIEERREFAVGSPQYPMPAGQVRGKFDRNLSWAGHTDPARRDEAAERLLGLEREPAFRALLDLLEP
ncbi:MAG: MmgE/PrpD family protein [Streptosporangiaceae bacterium]